MMDAIVDRILEIATTSARDDAHAAITKLLKDMLTPSAVELEQRRLNAEADRTVEEIKQ